jgi:hypothetical protein
MSTRVSKFLALTAAEKSLFLSATTLSPFFSLGLRIGGLARFQSWLEPSELASAKSPTIAEVSKLGALVNSAAFHSLAPTTCLTRSLLLRWLLQRRGIQAQLRIGVRSLEGTIEAHAWLEYQGKPINDAHDVAQRFAAFDEEISPKAFSIR